MVINITINITLNKKEMHLLNDYTKNSDQNRILCSLLDYSSIEPLPHSVERASNEATISFCTFRSTHSLPFDRSNNPHLVERTSCFYSFLVASIKQPTSNVPNLKPSIYDTSLSTLSKIQDKVCSIKRSKLTSLLRLLALALTSSRVII